MPESPNHSALLPRAGARPWWVGGRRWKLSLDDWCLFLKWKGKPGRSNNLEFWGEEGSWGCWDLIAYIFTEKPSLVCVKELAGWWWGNMRCRISWKGPRTLKCRERAGDGHCPKQDRAFLDQVLLLKSGSPGRPLTRPSPRTLAFLHADLGSPIQTILVGPPLTCAHGEVTRTWLLLMQPQFSSSTRNLLQTLTRSHIYWIRICILTSCPGDSCVH